jgi:hypothetical protein
MQTESGRKRVPGQDSMRSVFPLRWIVHCVYRHRTGWPDVECRSDFRQVPLDLNLIGKAPPSTTPHPTTYLPDGRSGCPGSKHFGRIRFSEDESDDGSDSDDGSESDDEDDPTTTATTACCSCASHESTTVPSPLLLVATIRRRRRRQPAVSCASHDSPTVPSPLLLVGWWP